MSLSRRSFVRSAGLGTAGALSGSLLGTRDLGAVEWPAPVSLPHDPIIRLSNNENNRGPGPAACLAIHEAVTPRMGLGYPPDYTNELIDEIARYSGVARENVILGTGSGPILAAAAYAFTSPSRSLVTGAPTYMATENAARRNGAEIRAIPVLPDNLELDLDGMADAAVGAGLIFFCNPNNPTGTVYRANVVEDFVRTVKRRSPETAILIDEAYMHYSFDPEVRTAVGLAMEFPGVFVTRTMSKAHGMAGLRVGYAVGQPATVDAIESAAAIGSMNTLSAAAALASMRDESHIRAEVAENAYIREFTTAAFRAMGFDVPVSHANCIFPNLGRPASWMRDQCIERGVRVGRDFPPYEGTHTRITLGTRAEMEKAVQVFRDVLG